MFRQSQQQRRLPTSATKSTTKCKSHTKCESKTKTSAFAKCLQPRCLRLLTSLLRRSRPSPRLGIGLGLGHGYCHVVALALTIANAIGLAFLFDRRWFLWSMLRFTIRFVA